MRICLKHQLVIVLFTLFSISAFTGCGRLTEEEKRALKAEMEKAFREKDYDELLRLSERMAGNRITPDEFIKEKDWHDLLIKGKADIVRNFVKAGYDIETGGKQKETPLIKTALLGDSVMTEIFVRAGAGLDKKDNAGQTALMKSVRAPKARFAIAGILMKAGADVDMRDTSGMTALMLAASSGEAEICEMLVKQGCSLDLEDKKNETAMSYAVKGLDSDRHMFHNHVRRIIRNKRKARAEKDSLVKEYRNRLIVKKRQDRLKIVRMLLERGARTGSGTGNAVLTYASRTGHADVVKLMLEFVKDISAEPDIFIHAVHGNSSEVVRLLLEAPMGKQLVNNTVKTGGKTPLMMAAAKGNREICRLLIEAGADVNLADVWGGTPLQEACYWGHLAVAGLLLKSGAGINNAERRGLTPLMRSASRGNTAIVKLLLSKNADVHATTKSGNTALMEAVKAFEEKADLVKLLLEKGVEVNHKNNAGKTALAIAREKKRNSIVRLLKKHGAR
jgi:serine/threonine-protein phosphatase 6 regulatory ankyrin repeat subunit B